MIEPFLRMCVRREHEAFLAADVLAQKTCPRPAVAGCHDLIDQTLENVDRAHVAPELLVLLSHMAAVHLDLLGSV